jgi:hypothetical protein
MSNAILLRAGLYIAAISSLIVTRSTVRAEDLKVEFDIPDKIECRDVTPARCAAMHPTQKVIEAKFRITANFAGGGEGSVVDFTYLITSPELRLKILDYLPNTTLESRYADDRIEVADFTENTDSISAEAKVAYSILSLNAVKNQLSRKTEQNQYQRIAPKSLVLASGTANRGHGVFYKLRPSNSESLEGAKEFTFLAIVPRDWRGDWCTFVCSARGTKKTLIGSTSTVAGVTKLDVGLFLCGDDEAGKLADRLCTLQEANGGALARRLAAEAAQAMHASSSQNIPLFERIDEFVQNVAHKKPFAEPDRTLDAARELIAEVERDFGRLAGTRRYDAAENPGEAERR